MKEPARCKRKSRRTFGRVHEKEEIKGSQEELSVEGENKRKRPSKKTNRGSQPGDGSNKKGDALERMEPTAA